MPDSFLLALRVVRKEPTQFKDLFAGFPRMGEIILARLAVTGLIILGSLALVIPGIIFALMYTFVPVLFVDPAQGQGRIPVRQAMRRSADISEGFRGTLFLIGLLLGIPIFVWSLVTYFSVVAGISPWIAELIAIFGGFLSIGPVSASSQMVVYDHALTRLQDIE